MTAALEGGEWSAARPGRTLRPGKTQYPFCRRLGGLHGRSGRADNLVPTGIRSQTVQPVVSRYTDWALRPTLHCYCVYIKGRMYLKVFNRARCLRHSSQNIELQSKGFSVLQIVQMLQILRCGLDKTKQP